MSIFNTKNSAILLIFFSSFSITADEFQKSLTIYSTTTPGAPSPDLYRDTLGGENNYLVPGYAIIRDKKSFEFKEGENNVNISDIPAFIDPTTVIFKPLSNPQTIQVLDQSYRFDLASNAKLLSKYLGQEITVDQNIGAQIKTFQGTLLSCSGGLLLQDKSGNLTSINNYANISYSGSTNNLALKPQLSWKINVTKSGNQTVEISYQTSGITWWADYNATYEEVKNSAQGLLSLNAWVSIVNKTGVSYEDAKLKLIAGYVNKVRTSAAPRAMLMAMDGASKMVNNEFEEKGLFEFHLYTLNNPTTIYNDSIKQIALFKEAHKIPVKKQYIYQGNTTIYYGYLNTAPDYGKQENTKIDVYLKFKNSKKSGLGMPLPAGKIRVSKIDELDKSWEFIGEDIIEHIPTEEDVTIKLGSAFDIIGSRKQINFSIDEKRRLISETFEVIIKNRKEEDIDVIVKENLYRWTNWQILQSSQNYQKIDSQSIQFPVMIKKGEEAKLQYTVQYSW